MPNIETVLPEIQKIRKDLHRNPELSYKEFKTTDLIEKKLRQWGLKFNRFTKLETGGFCDLGDKRQILGIRADIDALPILEEETHSVRSRNQGVMHACGHDYHTAVGLGLLKYFVTYPDELPGGIRVIFQPAEEAAPGGAETVIKENIWGNMVAILAVHVDADTEVGNVMLPKSAVQASSTSLFIKLKGPGGHTSQPHETADLVSIGAEFVTQIQAHTRKKVDPRQTLAFAFGKIKGGDTHNTIPQQIILRGTIRTHSNRVLSDTIKTMRAFAVNFAQTYGVEIKIDFPTSCPAVINDTRLAELFFNYMQNQKQQEQVSIPPKPSMGADDFAFYLKRIPGLYLQVGGKGKGTLHSQDLELDEGFLAFALETLRGFIQHYFKHTNYF